MRFLILAILFIGCAKSGSTFSDNINSPIVGSWTRPAQNITLSFSANRAMSWTKTLTGYNCTLTGAYSFDVSGSTLIPQFIGLSKSDDSVCETACVALTGLSCVNSKANFLPFTDGTGDTFSITENVLTLGANGNFNRVN